MFLFTLTNGKRVRISAYELWKINDDGSLSAADPPDSMEN